MKVFPLFFLLCYNGRDMQSASIQEVLVQCNGTSYTTSDGLEKQHWPLGRNRQICRPQAGLQPAQLRTASAMVALVCCGSLPVHCTRACEAVLRLLPNESESGIVAQWPCLTLSLVSARAASDFRGCGCCKHTLFQTNKIYWGSWLTYFDNMFSHLKFIWNLKWFD